MDRYKLYKSDNSDMQWMYPYSINIYGPTKENMQKWKRIADDIPHPYYLRKRYPLSKVEKYIENIKKEIDKIIWEKGMEKLWVPLYLYCDTLSMAVRQAKLNNLDYLDGNLYRLDILDDDDYE